MRFPAHALRTGKLRQHAIACGISSDNPTGPVEGHISRALHTADKGGRCSAPMMGVNQRAMNIQNAIIRAVRPVLPPALIPVADSVHIPQSMA